MNLLTKQKGNMKMNKTIKQIVSLLPTAALMLTTAACSNEDVTTTEPQPAAQMRTIHYEATVNSGAQTRAALSSDGTKYEFASGDKLYVQSADGTTVYGYLTLKSGDEGKTTGATFTGDLTVSGTPAADLALSATLVSTADAIHTIDGGKVTATAYPTTAIAATATEAISKYSHFTATSTYGAQSFTLSQQTAFVQFTITFIDGTTAGKSVAIDIQNGGASVRTGSVTSATVSSDVKATFVAAFADQTALSGAKVILTPDGGTATTHYFGGTTTLAKNNIYQVTKKDEDGTLLTYNGKAAIIATLGTAKYAIATENETDDATWTVSSNAYYSFANACTKFADGKTDGTYTAADVWRLPTLAELTALTNLSNSWQASPAGQTWTIGSASLFLPAAGSCDDDGDAVGVDEYGFYWSSTPDNDDVECACKMDFQNGYCGVDSSGYRPYGFTVRLFCQLPSE